MSTKAWKTRMSQIIPSYINKTSVTCGIILIVLHAIAWPSLAVWIAVDVLLIVLLIIQQLTKKPPEPLKIFMPAKGNYNKRDGFVDAMSELNQKKQSGGRSGKSTHTNSRQVKKYGHNYSRYTPDDRYIKTPRPATAVVRNRLSYSAAESSFGTSFGLRSATATPSPITATTNMVQGTEGSNTLTSSPWRHGYGPNDAKTSSVLRIARSNLPATMEMHSPIMTSPAAPRLEMVEAKSTPNKDTVVNALKQISHKRKRVHPLSIDKEDTEFLDSLPSVKRSRPEPKHQAVKRAWTKIINTESFNQPSMPDTKKHKKTVEKEKPPTTSKQELRSGGSHKEVDQQPVELESEADNYNIDTESAIEPIVGPTADIEHDTSNKENLSVEKEQEAEQQKLKQFGILKRMRTVYPSSRPSVDALRRKFPVLCSSGVAPKLVRQTSQVKYEDYVKDREDVYAKVKRVLEEEEEKDEVKKKKDEDASTVATSSSAASGLSISTTAPPNVTISSATQTVLSSSITSTAIVSTAPPPNVVISSSTSTSILPTVLPSLINPTSKPNEVSTSLPSILPTVVDQSSSKVLYSTSQKFSFPMAQPQLSTATIQQPSISLPSVTTSASSSVTLSGVGSGMQLPSTLTSTSSSTIQSQFNFLANSSASQVWPGLQLTSTSSNTSNITQPQFNLFTNSTASQVGPGLQPGLQLPSTAASTSNMTQPQFNFLTKTTASQVGQLSSIAASTSSTLQPQFNMLAKTTASLVGTSNLFSATANSGTALPTLGGLMSTTSSNILPSTLTTANATTKSPGLDGMEVAAPQANASFGNLFNNTSTISNTTNANFSGLFAASVAPTVNPLAVSLSSVASNFGNLFSQSTTTAVTRSLSHTFSFNPAQTTKPGNQLQQNPSKNIPPTFNFALPISTTGATQTTQPSINFGLPTSGTLLTSQPQTQSNTGFNFMANTNTSSSGFSFNLQPSLGNTGGNLFNAPPGGLNLPPTPAQPARRKPKTPSRSKARKK